MLAKSKIDAPTLDRNAIITGADIVVGNVHVPGAIWVDSVGVVSGSKNI